MSIRNPARTRGPRESRAAGWKINPNTGEPIYHAPGSKPCRVDAKKRRITARTNRNLRTLVSIRFANRHLPHRLWHVVAGDVGMILI